MQTGSASYARRVHFRPSLEPENAHAVLEVELHVGWAAGGRTNATLQDHPHPPQSWEAVDHPAAKGEEVANVVAWASCFTTVGCRLLPKPLQPPRPLLHPGAQEEGGGGGTKKQRQQNLQADV